MAGNYGKHKPLVEASASPSVPKAGRGKKTLRSLEARCSENGGHIVTHNFESTGGTYYPSEEFVFGADEGGQVLAHIGKQLGIKGAEKEAMEEEHKG